jgi:hypothetical protein
MIRTEYNALTDETLEIVLVGKELTERLKEEAEAETQKQAKLLADAVKAQAKADLLARLGITEDEARLLLS